MSEAEPSTAGASGGGDLEEWPHEGITPERLEMAARAAYGAFCLGTAIPLGEMPAWEQIPPEARADWRAVADAVLMVDGSR